LGGGHGKEKSVTEVGWCEEDNKEEFVRWPYRPYIQTLSLFPISLEHSLEIESLSKSSLSLDRTI
jgi:hypothetical protein